MNNFKKLLPVFCVAFVLASCDIFKGNEEEEVIQDPQNCDVVVDHVGYNLDLNKMTAEVAAINSTGAVEIPESISASGKYFPVVSIGAFAAQNNQRLSSVKLPPSVAIIKKLAFNNCKALKEIDFGLGVETIQTEAFEFSGLTSLVIPTNVKTIAADAFLYCNSLTTITINDSELPLDWNLKIGEYGLDEYALSSIYIGRNVTAARTVPSSNIIIGKEVTKIGYLPVPTPITIILETPIPPEASIATNNKALMESLIYVPEEAVEVYQNDPTWGKFWNITVFSPDQQQ